jgi:citrate/tricarballylate utilization protein
MLDIRTAFESAAQMKNLKGGHGDGCNFEAEDAFTPWRRWFHHFTLYGFLLCFASTSSGTVLHYVFDIQAPYGPFSLPKLLGVPGGIALCIGTFGLGYLKTKADPNLGAPRVWGGEIAFLVLLFGVSATGLALYAMTGSSVVSVILPLHLGLVFVFFILTPYSKMAHGFYRLAALIHEQQRAQ